MRSSGIATILRSIRELKEPIRVHGAPLPAQALIVARHVYETERPVVVLCPSDDICAQFASDLEALSGVIDQVGLQPCHLPTWEQSSYSPIAPSIRTRLARLACLHQIQKNAGGKMVVLTTLAGAHQASLSRQEFIRYSISLAVGESVGSREELSRRLLDAGYARVDTVEDPGTFAVRGDLIDVFAPGERAARVELFGDEIEKIRYFDPASQRTASGDETAVKQLTLPPAREALINPNTNSIIREAVKSRADDQAIHRSVRDPIVAAVQNGAYPDHSDAWAPFAYAEPGILWDYFDAPPEVIWVDELSALQTWDEFLEEQKRLAGEAPQSGLILPPVENLFRWNPSIEKSVRESTRLYLDRVQLADLEAVDTETAAPPIEGEPDEPRTHHRAYVRSNTDLARGSKQSLGDLEPKFKLWLRQGYRVIALATTQSQLERIRYLLEDRGLTCQIGGPVQPSLITLATAMVSEGFRWPAEGLAIVTESDILGTRKASKPRKEASAAKDWAGLQALSDLSVGDLVVHVDHGIGRYQGLVRLDLSGAPSDFLLLEYANKDKLYLPVYRLNVIQKYAGTGASVALDRLGSQQFAKTKEKVREAVRRLAIDLVQLYAQRRVRQGILFSPRDAEFSEFEARFPFDETPDQLKAIDDVLRDLETGKVMDRLVCGDVGYGKTEVAIRAAFRAVSDGKQVAVLVPTTVLAFQHEQSFRARLKEYPLKLESISRFKNAREQKEILEGVADGKIDIVIGTHRLLSKDVKFKDLGLIIVDEEHRFGVEHKEKLKTLKLNTPVLTLTATPIPRTLHMALSGLRDISLINTAPVDRLPIRTYVSKYDDALIQRAIQFELNRGGQIFFLHNRVQSIYEMAKRIQELVPNARVSVGHGQMGERELEETMLSFYQRKSDVLVCTTIIESGLDVPSANTIIINRADALGLAQLYQIRGRVGRAQQRGYAYLLIPAEGAVTEDAKKRLEVIQRFVELGSGFAIASHDLEIRGGGDLLGPQQSGHIAAVGFDLYTELLEEAIQDLEGKPHAEESAREPEIKAPFPAFLAEEYVPDIHQRLSLYRRFSGASTDSEVDRLEEELQDRFGPLPVEAQNLLWLIRIKQLLKKAGVEALTVGPEKVSLLPGPASRLDPVRGISLISSAPDLYQLTPDSKFVAKIATGTLRDLFFALESLLKRLGVA